jgi:4-oxalocrotonate tautomerase
MPYIEIKHAASLSSAVTANIISSVTTAYAEAAGVSASKVWVVVNEVSREAWGAGGKPLAARDAEPSTGSQK